MKKNEAKLVREKVLAQLEATRRQVDVAILAERKRVRDERAKAEEHQRATYNKNLESEIKLTKQHLAKLLRIQQAKKGAEFDSYIHYRRGMAQTTCRSDLAPIDPNYKSQHEVELQRVGMQIDRQISLLRLSDETHLVVNAESEVGALLIGDISTLIQTSYRNSW